MEQDILTTSVLYFASPANQLAVHAIIMDALPARAIECWSIRTVCVQSEEFPMKEHLSAQLATMRLLQLDLRTAWKQLE